MIHVSSIVPIKCHGVTLHVVLLGVFFLTNYLQFISVRGTREQRLKTG